VFRLLYLPIKVKARGGPNTDAVESLWNQLVRRGGVLGLSSQLDDLSSWPVISIVEEFVECLLTDTQEFGRLTLVVV